MNKNKVKPYIKISLISLLRKYPLEDISVKMVVEKAGICRASFYRNYLDINDVLKDIVRELFEPLYTNDMENSNITKLVFDIFNSIYLKKEIMVLLVKNDLDFLIHKELYNSSIKHINDLNIYKHFYQPYFFSGASSETLIAWAKNGFKESPKEMAEMFIKTLNGYMIIGEIN